ncbi:hypothetical protein PMF13cell1_02610 [Blautia producta]|uniref:Uncharacterized protein n=1 Tax=Blautia producta TaxID=33035 RepID=A0A4P6LWZ3_9FIRM|nr:hypothetical protein PMF13cell1_02610 [Blautia producta]
MEETVCPIQCRSSEIPMKISEIPMLCGCQILEMEEKEIFVFF